MVTRPGGRTWWPCALLVSVGLAGCGTAAAPGTPTGPYASFSPSPQVQVANRACTGVSPAPSPDLLYLSNPLIRQETSLQRVSDDLAGAIPGGNISTDTRLVADSADAIKAVVTPTTTTFCEPIRSHLLAKLTTLVDADHALAAAGSNGGGVAGALGTARAAYDALKAFVDSPQ